MSDHPPPLQRRVMEEWPDLLADADLENEDVVLLFRHGEPGPNGWEAMHWGRYVQVQEDEFLVDAQRDEANADGVLGKHRVATWDSGRDDDMTLLIRVAALRHELEHARQWDQVGPIPFQMTWMVDDVLRVKLEGVPGGSLFYNFKPLEQDANAAASVYVRRTRHADLVNVLARSRDHGQFARSLTPPPDPGSLLARTVCFLFLFRDLTETFAAQTGLPFDERLELYDRGGADLWRQLCARADAFGH